MNTNMMVSSSATNRNPYLHLRMKDLPAELMIDILSRLPVKTIIHCKLVCRKWRNLVLDSVFVNLHLSRSPAGLIIHHHPHSGFLSIHPGILMWVEIQDKVDHHHLHHDPLMSIDLNLATVLQNTRTRYTGSVNGLICLWEYSPKLDNTYICNPVTREYMILPGKQYYTETTAVIVYGFGVSLVTGEYKVVRIFKPNSYTSSSRPSELEAEVYTLGTCQWRRVKGVPYLVKEFNVFYGPYLNCSYLNGHCHWIVCDQDAPEKLCSFDFDKETFQLFPSPPPEAIQQGNGYRDQSLGVLNGCLCQLDVYYSQFTIWVMKEYGVKKSWHKEAVIEQGFSFDIQMPLWQPMYLIEGLKDGSILAVCRRNKLWAFYPKGKKIEATQLFDLDVSGMAYRPSFLKLRNFKSEKVRIFLRSTNSLPFMHQPGLYSF